MNEIMHLSGKVRQESLPVFESPVGVKPDLRKRLRLPQGELAQVFNGHPGIHYLACIELVPGTTRGHHYHLNKQEFLYVISGELVLTVEDIHTRQRETLVCREGDLTVIETSVAHTLQVLRRGHAMEFSPVPFDAADVHRYALA